MPKTFYNNEAEIPVGLREAYAAKNGRWELTELDKDHSVMVAKASLEATQTGLKTQISELTKQKTQLEQLNRELAEETLPDGYEAVPKEIAALGQAARDAGISDEEIITLKPENERFRQAEESRRKNEFFAQVAADETVGLNPAAFTRIALQENLDVQAETVKKDGVETTNFFVVEKDGEAERKIPVREYVEKSAAFQPFKASLYEKADAKPGVRFPRQKERESTASTKTAAERQIEKQNARLVQG